MAGAVVAQWEGVTAATPAEGTTVRQQAVAPDGRAGAGGEGHGVKRDVPCAPNGLEFRAKKVSVGGVIV